MIRTRLADIAIILYEHFHDAKINFGLFGDYAISVISEDEKARKCDDIHCIVSATKPEILSLIDGKDGFSAINQPREDYIGFLWSERPDRSNPILVEIFCDRFSEWVVNISSGIESDQHTVYGHTRKEGVTWILDPFFLFRDKIRLSATRNKFVDSHDLRILEEEYGLIFKKRVKALDPAYVGRSIKNSPDLERMYEGIGVDIEHSLEASKSLKLEQIFPPPPAEVQRHVMNDRYYDYFRRDQDFVMP